MKNMGREKEKQKICAQKKYLEREKEEKYMHKEKGEEKKHVYRENNKRNKLNE